MAQNGLAIIAYFLGPFGELCLGDPGCRGYDFSFFLCSVEDTVDCYDFLCLFLSGTMKPGLLIASDNPTKALL